MPHRNYNYYNYNTSSTSSKVVDATRTTLGKTKQEGTNAGPHRFKGLPRLWYYCTVSARKYAAWLVAF